jgi:hypothetical protein
MQRGLGKKMLLWGMLITFLLVIQFPLQAHPLLHKEKKTHSRSDSLRHPPRDPKKASLMALLPGMGQAYNHKYWKIPIVYVGFGVIGYFAVINRRYYKDFKDAYSYKVSHPDCNPNSTSTECQNELAKKYDKNTLKTIRDYYRRNMQLSYIIGGAWYLLQIIDADVDAHLSHWNVSKNLSLDVAPVVNPVSLPGKPAYKGVSLRFNF